MREMKAMKDKLESDVIEGYESPFNGTVERNQTTPAQSNPFAGMGRAQITQREERKEDL